MTFDFRKIESDYPKAFALLKEWIHKENSPSEYKYDVANYISPEFHVFNNGNIGIGHEMEAEIFNPLELDFFFDEQGIYGRVEIAAMNQWEYSHRENGGYEFTATGFNPLKEPLYKSRSEALSALWLKEFEILEQRLEKDEKK